MFSKSKRKMYHHLKLVCYSVAEDPPIRSEWKDRESLYAKVFMQSAAPNMEARLRQLQSLKSTYNA